MSDKSPADIEREIEETRRDMARTVDALEERLSPGRIVDYVTSYLRDSPRGRGMVDGTAYSVARNPLPVALIAIGVAWLAMGSTGDGRRGTYRQRVSGPDPAELVGYDRSSRSAREAAEAFRRL